MSSSTTRYAAASLAMAALASAIVTPNLPYGGIVDNAGSDCKIGWAPDSTGQWNNFDIELMTGDNQAFVHLSWVARGLDGTGSNNSYTWTCPTVDPPAPIYFYQFVQSGQPNTYTTRFTIANADGSTVPAPQSTQPDGSAIPWGTGRIISGGDGTSGSSSSASSGSSSGSSSASGSSGASSRTSSSASSATSQSSATSSDDGTDTTVVTVPNTRTTGLTSARTTGTTASNAAGANANASASPTGAAARSAAPAGSMAAGLGLGLSLLAGWAITA